MNARDVDDEFERAYRRLFSSSASTASEASAQAGSASVSKPVARFSKAPYTKASFDRTASAGPSASLVDHTQHTSRKDALLQFLARQHSASKATATTKARRPAQAPPTQLERPQQARSSHSSLEALARHGTSSDAKGKERAHSHLDTGDRHVERAGRSPSIPVAAAPHSGSMQHSGGVAYYPYPQPPYQEVSTPLVGPSLSPMPGQAVTWTQPIISAGLMPAVAYPGFTTSFTFSQPQFFASPPQQMQPAITAMPTDAWPHQYTPQQSAATSSATQSAPEQQRSRKPEPRLHKQQRPSTSDQPSKRALKEMVARLMRQKKWLSSGHEVKVEKPKQKPPRQKQQKQKAWKPLLDENGVRIPRKRGRPRLYPLPEDVKPVISGSNAGVQVKTETQEGIPVEPLQLSGASDGGLPLAEEASIPYKNETHTLFVHSSRRLRWLARCAIANSADVEAPAMPSALNKIQWARWSFFSAAYLQSHPADDTSPRLMDNLSPTATSSQSDPAGLFPRERRREYVALRKQLHSAVHTATPRICLPRLARYLANVSAAAARIELPLDHQAYLERKHRPAKLAKYILKPRKATALDLRRLWSVWARAAHARFKAVSPQKRVSFAPCEEPASPLRGEGVEAGLRFKQEPESPSKQQALLSRSFVKAEPASDDVMTSPIPSTPILDARMAVNSQPEPLPEMHADTRRDSPLFLRRNFRAYRLLGMSDLPLS